ncbi:MAG: ATP synthase F1 subunit gamma [Lachnospiraceae bacterium]|nr:ATP synthase F1 subunit gamma [Lachnospiraceae bacterium]
MASIRDIKRRRQSIQSTQQIAKAMNLVATVKLQRAKQHAERSRVYFRSMYITILDVLEKAGDDLDHDFLKPRQSEKKAVIVITSNRGLAGGYNSNVIKLVTKGIVRKNNLDIYAVGKKGRDTLKQRYNLKSDFSDCIEDPVYADAMRISKEVLDAYLAGEVGEIYLAYTAFVNTVVHEPTMLKLLPVDAEEHRERIKDKARSDKEPKLERKPLLTPMIFEPPAEVALDFLIPKYITSLIYGGMVEAVASENGARMQAMDAATQNAEEMIEDLSLLYNRARQSSITQELTEIIAGANAIS